MADQIAEIEARHPAVINLPVSGSRLVEINSDASLILQTRQQLICLHLGEMYTSVSDRYAASDREIRDNAVQFIHLLNTLRHTLTHIEAPQD